jgi:hypothetical protein
MCDVDTPAASPTVTPTVSPSRSEDEITADEYRVTLSASRVAAWLGFEHELGNKSRIELFEIWNAPRKGQKPLDDSTNLCSRVNPRCAHGIAMEPKALDAYRMLTGLRVDDVTRPNFRKHPTYPWLGAAPDGYTHDVLSGPHARDPIIIEVKCPSSLMEDPDKMVVPKTSWLLQIYMQLECFQEAKACDLVVFNGTHLWLWRVWRDLSVECCHVPYKVENYKRTVCGTMKVAYSERPPMRLMDAMLPELAKYKIIATASRISMPFDQKLLRPDLLAIKRIKVEFAAWRNWATRQLAVSGPTAVGTRACNITTWAKSFPGEKRTNPHEYTYIDRFYIPTSKTGPTLGTPPFAERLLNVRWLNASMTEFWEHNPYNPLAFCPRGGFVRSEYYPVKQLKHEGGNLRNL